MKRELHVISNGQLSFEQLGEISIRIIDNIDYLHIRERERTTKELYEGVQLLLKKGIPSSKLVINDRVDIALLTGVSRVQLGYNSVDTTVVKARFSYLHVGCSVHSFVEAQQARRKGADSIMYGHLFPTRSKEGLPPRGLEEVSNISREISTPVIAIGGIIPENIEQTLRTGVAGVAVMSGVLGASDPFQKVTEYKEMIRKWEKNNE
ncbi:thiazole tautomerase TenI [Microbacteriaceae bacterium 4G12]